MTWLLTLAVMMAGCDGSGARATAEAAEATVSEELRFPGSTATLDGLGRRALEALAAGDAVALGSLRLSEHEHNEVVWPELPASRPEIGFPVDFAWENIEARNRRSLARILPMYEGLEVTLRTVQCRGGTQTYDTFHVLTDCWTIFDIGGREGPFAARLFKDVLVRGSGHKIFRYHEAGPERHRPRGGT